MKCKERLYKIQLYSTLAKEIFFLLHIIESNTVSLFCFLIVNCKHPLQIATKTCFCLVVINEFLPHNDNNNGIGMQKRI